MAQGIIKRYDFRKGFGFIVDDKSGEDFFFHKSEWQGDGPIRQGIAVKFNGQDSDKGPQAESVVPLEGGSKAPKASKPANNTKPAKTKPTAKSVAKPASLDDRVTSLENTLGTWKMVSILAIVGVVVLILKAFIF